VPTCDKCPTNDAIARGDHKGRAYADTPCAACNWTGDALAHHGRSHVAIDALAANGHEADHEGLHTDADPHTEPGEEAEAALAVMAPCLSAEIRATFVEFCAQWLAMSARQRDAVIMRLQGVMTCAQIGDRLGTRKQAVDQLVARAGKAQPVVAALRLRPKAGAEGGAL
jgi:DNA-binding CsgD family transcriptional regulator